MYNTLYKRRTYLQEIGDIFEVTRMRICQIEKNILRKLQTTVKNNN
ncbi:MAG: sigma factor-like helix-turn-helix DNA-binding protein [Promethearchaeota archaeon]